MQSFPTKTAFLVASVIGATVALPMLAKAGPAPTPSFEAEKCYGIAVAGKWQMMSSAYLSNGTSGWFLAIHASKT
jgi:hypothetical protein